MDETLKYQYADGRIVEMDNFERESDEFLFKVNLPDSEKSFISGNGEGVWACTSDESYSKWADDSNSKIIIYVKILNDSIYYTGLEYGTLVAVELRGERRPVALYDELIHKYKDCNWK